MRLRSARPDEAGALGALALRSKAHWGYDASFLERVRDELAVPSDACDGVHVVVAERDGVVVGFHRITGDPPVGELDALFVDEPAIGQGVGAALWVDAVATARRLGFSALTIDADPGAESFYVHHGAVRIGAVPSGSIPGRMLPQLRLDL